MNSFIFLDRDGVINENRDDYVKSIDEFIFLPNTIDAIKKFINLGFKIIIITNQSVINRGIISENELQNIHLHMLNELNKCQCQIEKIYFCPHRPNENCNCRKPRTGMIINALSDFSIDISKSWLIGDSNTDIELAKNMGLKSIKLERNGNLLKAVKIIEGI
jgi:D-glycero-D-manno-heptose 1,7-bisphosphate phosphatase